MQGGRYRQADRNLHSRGSEVKFGSLSPTRGSKQFNRKIRARRLKGSHMASAKKDAENFEILQILQKEHNLSLNNARPSFRLRSNNAPQEMNTMQIQEGISQTPVRKEPSEDEFTTLQLKQLIYNESPFSSRTQQESKMRILQPTRSKLFKTQVEGFGAFKSSKNGFIRLKKSQRQLSLNTQNFFKRNSKDLFSREKESKSTTRQLIHSSVDIPPSKSYDEVNRLAQNSKNISQFQLESSYPHHTTIKRHRFVQTILNSNLSKANFGLTSRDPSYNQPLKAVPKMETGKTHDPDSIQRLKYFSEKAGNMFIQKEIASHYNGVSGSLIKLPSTDKDIDKVLEEQGIKKPNSDIYKVMEGIRKPIFQAIQAAPMKNSSKIQALAFNQGGNHAKNSDREDQKLKDKYIKFNFSNRQKVAKNRFEMNRVRNWLCDSLKDIHSEYNNVQKSASSKTRLNEEKPINDILSNLQETMFKKESHFSSFFKKRFSRVSYAYLELKENLEVVCKERGHLLELIFGEMVEMMDSQTHFIGEFLKSIDKMHESNIDHLNNLHEHDMVSKDTEFKMSLKKIKSLENSLSKRNREKSRILYKLGAAHYSQRTYIEDIRYLKIELETTVKEKTAIYRIVSSIIEEVSGQSGKPPSPKELQDIYDNIKDKLRQVEDLWEFFSELRMKAARKRLKMYSEEKGSQENDINFVEDNELKFQKLLSEEKSDGYYPALRDVCIQTCNVGLDEDLTACKAIQVGGTREFATHNEITINIHQSSMQNISSRPQTPKMLKQSPHSMNTLDGSIIDQQISMSNLGEQDFMEEEEFSSISEVALDDLQVEMFPALKRISRQPSIEDMGMQLKVNPQRPLISEALEVQRVELARLADMENVEEENQDRNRLLEEVASFVKRIKTKSLDSKFLALFLAKQQLEEDGDETPTPLNKINEQSANLASNITFTKMNQEVLKSVFDFGDEENIQINKGQVSQKGEIIEEKSELSKMMNSSNRINTDRSEENGGNEKSIITNVGKRPILKKQSTLPYQERIDPGKLKKSSKSRRKISKKKRLSTMIPKSKRRPSKSINSTVVNDPLKQLDESIMLNIENQSLLARKGTLQEKKSSANYLEMMEKLVDKYQGLVKENNSLRNTIIQTSKIFDQQQQQSMNNFPASGRSQIKNPIRKNNTTNFQDDLKDLEGRGRRQRKNMMFRLGADRKGEMDVAVLRKAENRYNQQIKVATQLFNQFMNSYVHGNNKTNVKGSSLFSTLKKINNIYSKFMEKVKRGQVKVTQSLYIFVYRFFGEKYSRVEHINKNYKQLFRSLVKHKDNQKVKLFSQFMGIRDLLDENSFMVFHKMVLYLKKQKSIDIFKRHKEITYIGAKHVHDMVQYVLIKNGIQQLDIDKIQIYLRKMELRKREGQWNVIIDIDRAFGLVLKMLLDLRSASEELFFAADINGDGSLEYHEFQRLVRFFEPEFFLQECLNMNTIFMKYAEQEDDGSFAISFSLFLKFCEELDLCSKESVSKFMVLSRQSGYALNMEDLLANWKEIKEDLKLWIVELGEQESLLFLYDKIERLVKNYQIEYKDKAWINFKLLELDINRLFTNAYIEDYILPEELRIIEDLCFPELGEG